MDHGNEAPVVPVGDFVVQPCLRFIGAPVVSVVGEGFGRAGSRDGKLDSRLGEARELEAGLKQIVPVGFFDNRLTVEKADDHIQAFVHPATLVGCVDADLHRVVHQRAGADPEHGPTAGDVIGQNHAVGPNERVVVRQGGDAGAEADVACARRRRR